MNPFGSRNMHQHDITNVSGVVDAGLCISCGACAAACPGESISMQWSPKGMRIPLVEEESCLHCSICLYVCYGYGVDSEEYSHDYDTYTPALGPIESCIIGRSKNQNILEKAGSGGILTSLALDLLKSGRIDGVVTSKIAPGTPPIPKACICDSIDAMTASAGSNYLPVSIAECIQNLQADRRYAIIGLPCVIYGIKRLMRIDKYPSEHKPLLLGLMCGGMPNYNGLLYLLNKYNLRDTRIEELQFRAGSHLGSLRITSANRKDGEIFEDYPDYWDGLYRMFLPTRCTMCKDAFNLLSDISFGDFLYERSSFTTKTLVIARTEEGSAYLRESKFAESIEMQSISASEAFSHKKGLITFKGADLVARMQIYSRLNQPLPISNYFDTLPIDNKNRIRALLTITGQKLASNYRLWGVLKLYSLFANSIHSLTLKSRDARYSMGIGVFKKNQENSSEELKG